MDTSLFISSGALQSFQKKVDTISNNVANVNTNGFKRREATFTEILASQINQVSQGQEQGRLTPSGIREGFGSRLGLTQLEMDQGQAIQTGNPFDLMIQGNGFFKLQTNEGIRYTRDGAFHLSPNPTTPGTYNLVTQSGGILQNENGQPVVLNDLDKISINTNGEILVKGQRAEILVNGQRVPLPKIAVVNINNPHILSNVGDNEYQIDPNAIPNGTNPTTYEQPSTSQISTGYLEGSNVDLTKEMADLMVSQRGFQLNSRAVSYADQMMGIANNIIKE
ncbi:MAG TPA: flagellar hook-basal body protein [Bacillota bacterium]|nr:flagellar hook-basal body protein [Bacillota bacterium]